MATAKITVTEARKRAKYHGALVRSSNFDITTPSGRYDWECLNYYNGIIIRGSRKGK